MPKLTETNENNTSELIENSDSPVLPIQTSLANVQAATSSVSNDLEASSEAILQSSAVTSANTQNTKNPTNQESEDSSNKSATCCESCGGGKPPQLVFALGQLGFDYGTEARRDSIMQHMDGHANPNDPHQCLEHLEKNPWDTAAIIWTLNLDATPIYAVQAEGAFARETCQRICHFLGEQTRGEVERVSIPGYIVGNVRLSNNQVIPVIRPELRGMYSWNTSALVQAVCGTPPSEKASRKDKDAYAKKAQPITNFLLRVYEELRNLGISAQDRAINYAATNAFQAAAVFGDAIEFEMDLDMIEVERSPICRPDSDCWDVKLTFFKPSKVFEQARKVYLFTVDVSDIVPVMVGAMRSWFVR